MILSGVPWLLMIWQIILILLSIILEYTGEVNTREVHTESGVTQELASVNSLCGTTTDEVLKEH